MSDVVFISNRVGYEGASEARLTNFLSHCHQGDTDSWSCKKAATQGDLYLFWFGGSVQQIVGAGVCSSAVWAEDNKGVDWTPRAKLWSCRFSPLRKLIHPVTADHIHADALLNDWWESRPYRGRPKSVPKKVASHLLSLVTRLNPSLLSLLKTYRPSASTPGLTIPDDDDAPPPRVKYTFTRLVRNTAKGENLKQLYQGNCQVCGYRIQVPASDVGWYAEVHHMRPLGGKHAGLDNWNNMLVLCPTCHAEFDALALAINPKTSQIVSCDRGHPHTGRQPVFRPKHALADLNIEYHWRRFNKASAGAEAASPPPA